MKNFSHTIISWLFFLILSCASLLVLADEHDSHGHREHAAHEHGVGQLNVVVEGDVLQLELVSPAMNIVGFEHKPETHRQELAVEEAVVILMKGEQVFILPAAARCQLQEADVDTELLADAGHDDGHEGETHADFDATYIFKCATPDRLQYVDVQLFSLFPGTGEIDAQVISSSGQSVVELGPQSVRLRLQ